MNKIYDKPNRMFCLILFCFSPQNLSLKLLDLTQLIHEVSLFSPLVVLSCCDVLCEERWPVIVRLYNNRTSNEFKPTFLNMHLEIKCYSGQMLKMLFNKQMSIFSASWTSSVTLLCSVMLPWWFAPVVIRLYIVGLSLLYSASNLLLTFKGEIQWFATAFWWWRNE